MAFESISEAFMATSDKRSRQEMYAPHLKHSHQHVAVDADKVASQKSLVTYGPTRYGK
jgi:hypothetical protein